MKVQLMSEISNSNSNNTNYCFPDSITKDLELQTLLKAMSSGDKFLYKIISEVLLAGLKNGVETICYRQEVLKDCLKNPALVREIYQISSEAVECKKKHWWISSAKYPSSILSNSVYTLKDLVFYLTSFRNIADQHTTKFSSKGFIMLFDMLKKELDDEYLNKLKNYLHELEFNDGIYLSARLTRGNKGCDYILRKPFYRKKWIQFLLEKKKPVYTFRISDRDISGCKALDELKDKGINNIANTVAQSSDHVIGFFSKLQEEIAFYIGCLNLYEQLVKLNIPVTFPVAVEQNQRKHSFTDLCDVCLALTVNNRVVGNDACLDNKNLTIITGANKGGKSTFLRSIGLAQLMMQSGMFVTARTFTANICNSLFTHFKREEDKTMESGKLDEELKRFNSFVPHITKNTLFLLNESFAATNEREGSEIAGQIIKALLEKEIKVFYVTHLFDFANDLSNSLTNNIILLRAERLDDGSRTYKLFEGQPLQTSFGHDLYYKVFREEINN